jgi:hypothetical protein
MNIPSSLPPRPLKPQAQRYLLTFEGRPWSARRLRFSAAHKQLLRMQRSETIPFQAKPLFGIAEVLR